MARSKSLESSPELASQARAELYRRMGFAEEPRYGLEALTHRSFANEARRRSARGYTKGKSQQPPPLEPVTDNQRLEFLGDAVLGLCVSEALMAHYPDAQEGALSRMRATLVNADSLAQYARKVAVAPALRMGKGAEATGDRSQANVLADAVEALVAAAYLEGGMELAREVVEQVVGERLRGDALLASRDPKSEYQERVQGRGMPAPHYELVDMTGPEHDRRFTMRALVGGVEVGRGIGRTKKQAQQEAARMALKADDAPATGELDEAASSASSASATGK